MTHAFDLHSIFLARHAQHVVLIHFPIALFLIGILFDLLARLRDDTRLAGAAHLNLAAAAIFIVPAYLTGMLAWRFALAGQRMRGVLLDHMLMASATTLLVIAAWWLRSRAYLHPITLTVIELVGAMLIVLTAHLGGFLSGVNT
jgi:uncharacterized membrane protein